MRRPARSSFSPVAAVPPDPRFRRPDHRPARRRATRFVVRTLVALAAVAASGALSVYTAHAIVESPWLRVNHLIVSGTKRLDEGEVEKLVAGIREESILRIDFSSYRRQVLESKWVADVTLWRRLPSTVEVRVREREPLALARVGHQLYLTDASGILIEEYGPEYADLELPIVTGLTPAEDADAESSIPSERLQLLANFLQGVTAWPAMRERISEIDVSRPHNLAILLNDDPAWLQLGDEEFLERLKTYVEVRPALTEQLGPLDKVDLRFDGRLFVRPLGEAHR